MSPLELLRSRLDDHGCNPRGNGDTIEFCCPLHDDRRASAGATLRDGRVLILCQVCGKERTGEIVEKLGLTWRDLSDDDRKAKREITATYDYVDEHGTLLFQVVRYFPKDFRQRRPDGRGGWIWNLKGTRRVLYRLPAVIDAVAAGRRVWFPEGEKDVHSLEKLGEVATTNPMGAGKWSDEYAKALRGADVAVIADNDEHERGLAHARVIVKSLTGVANSVTLFGVPNGRKDISEHLAAGGKLSELERLGMPERDYEAPRGASADVPQRVVLPPPSAPMEVARKLVARRYLNGDLMTLRHWRGGWWEWQGPRWVEIEQRAVRAGGYAFTENAVCQSGDEQVPWAPNRRRIADLLEALAAIVHLPERVSMPTWLNGAAYNGLVASVANGLLDVGRRELLPHDPRFFNATSVPFDFDPDALHPERWKGFLEALWGEDRDSPRVLAEWFGYVISGRTDLHKILLIVGPTRAGKGVISRTLGKLVGDESVAGPTLSSLSGDFGLAPLLGKSLAVVSDARLNGRGANVVVERLLSISGEDALTVNRKYRDQWTGKLPARLMLCSNELPHLGDASMAVAGRFVPLLLTESFYGKEDLKLEDKIAAELPGILNWALDGLGRLAETGGFTRPPNVDDTLRTLQDLASPVGAFVRDCCEVRADRSVRIDALYDAFRAWAEANGHAKSTKQVFGRDLRAALGGRLKVTQPGLGDNRLRAYRGVGLTPDAQADMAAREAERSKR